MKKYTFNDLIDIVAKLRSENGCPWDREQTVETLKPCLIEECYEVIDACEKGGITLADELGDLLLQIVMISQINAETESFCINDVISCICEKMIRRHPHVFGSVSADTTDEVLENWDKIKSEEKGLKSVSDTLNDVAKSLPSLLYSAKLQKKAAKTGFDFPDAAAALEKIYEETDELKEAVSQNSNVYEEIGDLLFSVVNVSRHLNINPELALSDSSKKFLTRFCETERLAKSKNLDFATLPLEEKDKLWDEVKSLNKA